MDKKKFEIIKNLIVDLGGFEVIKSTNETPQKFISFKQIVKKTTLNIYLFYEISNDEVFLEYSLPIILHMKTHHLIST